MLYNAALEQRILAYRRQRKYVSLFDQYKDLTELRAADENYRKLATTMERATALKRLDLAFQAFFRRCKAGKKPGFPRFRSRRRFNVLIFDTNGWQLEGRRLHLHGIGTFTTSSRPVLRGTIESLRIKKVIDDYWEVQVDVDVGDAPPTRPSTNSVGIDVGIRAFATMSDGNSIVHPRFLHRSLAALQKAQRVLSLKKRGSRRRVEVKRALARQHRRVANRRKNFLHQTTRLLINSYSGFAVEKLAIDAMLQQVPTDTTVKQGHGLHRGIMDSAWGTFISMLAYKAEEAGLPLVKVNPKGTSQRCSGCGSVVRKTLRDRVHKCPACGLVLDRDLNAALNIKASGAEATSDLRRRRPDEDSTWDLTTHAPTTS